MLRAIRPLSLAPILCAYFFESVGFSKETVTVFALNSPYNDVKCFAALSQLLESVGEFLWRYIFIYLFIRRARLHILWCSTLPHLAGIFDSSC